MQMSYSEYSWMEVGGGEMKFSEIGVGVDLGIFDTHIQL